MSFLARGDNMPISDDEEQRTQPVVAGAVNNADHMRQGGTSTLATVSTGARSMKTPTRSFYHQTFHGSFGKVPFLLPSRSLNPAKPFAVPSQTIGHCSILFLCVSKTV